MAWSPPLLLLFAYFLLHFPISHAHTLSHTRQELDSDILANDIDNSHDLMNSLLNKMDNDAQRIAIDPIAEESRDLQEVAKWSENEKRALVSATYASPLNKPKIDAVEEEEKRLSELELKSLRDLGLVGKNEFAPIDGEDANDEARKAAENKAYSVTDTLVEQALDQTEQSVQKANDIMEKLLQPTVNDSINPLGISNVGLAAAQMATAPPKKPSAAQPQTPQIPQQQPLQPLLPFQNAVQTGMNVGNKQDTGTGQVVGDMMRMAANIGTYFTAAIVPSLARGYLRQENIIPSKYSMPPLTTHDVVSPHQPIRGYSSEYYASLASGHDMPLWWAHSGANIPPPWFQSNAPPNRAHLGRAATNVPAPPFIDSPYRSTILDYWTGKRPRMLAPVPKAWPQHHMMSGPWNGDGAMKCPCPGAPQLMCDCQAIEYDASDVNEKKTPEEEADVSEYIKKRFQNAARKSMGKLLKAPYPEMAIMSLLS